MANGVSYQTCGLAQKTKMITEQEQYDAENQIPIAKSNFKLGLMVLRNDIEWLAEELANAADTPDKLEALIVDLQKRYEELRNSNPKLWEDEMPSDRQ